MTEAELKELWLNRFHDQLPVEPALPRINWPTVKGQSPWASSPAARPEALDAALQTFTKRANEMWTAFHNRVGNQDEDMELAWFVVKVVEDFQPLLQLQFVPDIDACPGLEQHILGSARTLAHFMYCFISAETPRKEHPLVFARDLDGRIPLSWEEIGLKLIEIALEQDVIDLEQVQRDLENELQKPQQQQYGSLSIMQYKLVVEAFMAAFQREYQYGSELLKPTAPLLGQIEFELLHGARDGQYSFVRCQEDMIHPSNFGNLVPMDSSIASMARTIKMHYATLYKYLREYGCDLGPVINAGFRPLYDFNPSLVEGGFLDRVENLHPRFLRASLADLEKMKYEVDLSRRDSSVIQRAAYFVIKEGDRRYRALLKQKYVDEDDEYRALDLARRLSCVLMVALQTHADGWAALDQQQGLSYGRPTTLVSLKFADNIGN